jgi:hypothetical protein
MSATITRKAFLSSDLSRNAPPVFLAAESAPVEVTRRDGESLILMSSSENEARDVLLELAAQFIAITTQPDERPLGERFVDRFDWMCALSPAAREACALSLIEAARASFATKKARLLVNELTAWRETAMAVAEGLDKIPALWLDEFTIVDRP